MSALERLKPLFFQIKHQMQYGLIIIYLLVLIVRKRPDSASILF